MRHVVYSAGKLKQKRTPWRGSVANSVTSVRLSGTASLVHRILSNTSTPRFDAHKDADLLEQMELVPSASASLAVGPLEEELSLREKLDAVLSKLTPPDRVVESAGGGYGAYYFAPDQSRFASIGIDEDGDLTVLYSDRASGTATVDEIDSSTDLSEVRKQINQFISGD